MRAIAAVVLLVPVVLFVVFSSPPASNVQSSLGTAKSCPNCTFDQCTSTFCPIDDPYACVSGSAHGGCSSDPLQWVNTASCDTCCDITSCLLTCPLCNSTFCEDHKPYKCSNAAPYICYEGKSDNACAAKASNWEDNPSCDACCNMASCFGGGPTLPPWHPNHCPPCETCPKPTPCGHSAPLLCEEGPAKDGCSKDWTNAHSCYKCCNVSHCLPPPPPPRPPSPWDIVPKTENCTLNASSHSGLPILSPDSRRTKYGGIDVTGLGCRAKVSESCCGYLPRFNWIISTCHTDPRKRTSMACTHKDANTTAMNIRYISAYQYNGTHFVKDHESSVMPRGNQSFVDLSHMYLGGGWPQDWDLKYGPTTNKSGTQGLGPPGFAVVMSAEHFSWSALYMLNQLTLNRGPGGEVMKDNCWSSSSGEFDLLESPFWAGVHLPPTRLYTTVTADSGRCLPSQKKIPESFAKESNSKYACEACGCEPGYVCFADSLDDVGYQPMGCLLKNASHDLPPHAFVFEADGSNTTCGAYFGSVSGGQDGTGYFEQQNINGTGEVIYVGVLDRTGVYVYRWPADDATGLADKVWPGIHKYGSADVLPTKRPDQKYMHVHTPCTKWDKPCGVFEPSCTGDCPLLSAAGEFGLDEMSGAFAAEAARDGLNWWDLMDDTNQTQGRTRIKDLSKWVKVEHFTPPLPFYCNHSCGEKLCHNADRCPGTIPYMCESGDGFMGCSNSSAFWPTSGHCGKCCDVRKCEKPCTSCSTLQCDLYPCSEVDPFACTEGPSAGGCSGDKDYWPQQPSCFTCCNELTCAGSPSPSPFSRSKKAKAKKRKE